MSRRVLTALPVFNEERHIPQVLPEVVRYSRDVLVVDDGSTDGTATVLRQFPNVQVVRHATNRGYGAGLRSAFEYAQRHRFDALVTIDCDGQHQPALIPELVERLFDAEESGGRPIEMVSGSRYLRVFAGASIPPADRRKINVEITTLLNEALSERLGLTLTDGFCGFKAYRVEALDAFDITELGYAMPLQHWVQAASAGLKIVEFPVPLVYLDEQRSFGGSLDDAARRRRYYYEVLGRELAEHKLPCPAALQTEGVCG